MFQRIARSEFDVKERREKTRVILESGTVPVYVSVYGHVEGITLLAEALLSFDLCNVDLEKYFSRVDVYPRMLKILLRKADEESMEIILFHGRVNDTAEQLPVNRWRVNLSF